MCWFNCFNVGAARFRGFLPNISWFFPKEAQAVNDIRPWMSSYSTFARMLLDRRCCIGAVYITSATLTDGHDVWEPTELISSGWGVDVMVSNRYSLSPLACHFWVIFSWMQLSLIIDLVGNRVPGNNGSTNLAGITHVWQAIAPTSSPSG